MSWCSKTGLTADPTCQNIKGCRHYPLIKVNRLDAARAQIETAIHLYFAEADPVSIHTLAAAAHDILDAVAKRTGVFRSSKRKYLESLKPEFRDEAGKRLNAARNFFKHAGTMQVDSIRLHPFLSEVLLYDAGELYQAITHTLPGLMLAFRTWFGMQHPRYLNDEMRSACEKAAQVFHGRTKKEFFAVASDVLAQPDVQDTIARIARSVAPGTLSA